MDQSGISNRSSAIKDNKNIHSLICHQSYISTCAFYKKQMRPKESWKKGRQSKSISVLEKFSRNREIYNFSKWKFFLNR